MERIDCGQGFPVYVDAASTPDALIASLRAARQVAHGRVICVLGDDQRKTTMQIDRMNSVARQFADLTGKGEAGVQFALCGIGAGDDFNQRHKCHRVKKVYAD